MNTIIVGANGRPSIAQMMETFKFNVPIDIFVQYHKKSGEEYWKRMEVYEDGFVALFPTQKPILKNGDKAVFWGSRAMVDRNGAIVYNDPKSLSNASKKGLARKIFKEKGIATPKTEFEVLAARRNISFPMIVRPEKHRAGNNFHVVNSVNELENAFKKVNNGYISELYPKTKEYRVHVASGKALLVKQKPEPDDKSMVAWNFAQNEKPWATINRKDYDFEMISLALKAVGALELDFGAVDIMSYPSNPDLPKHVVVEVNTAPSYTPYLISKYGAYFDLAFSSEEKLEPWDFTKFKQAKSFAWKNFQLKGENKNG